MANKWPYLYSATIIIFCIFIQVILFIADNKIHEYKGSYESARNQLEALQRTIGKVNSAYECKLKHK